MTDVLLRCDFSPASGLGHLKRCVVLAGELASRGLKSLILVDHDAPDPAVFLKGDVAIERIPEALSAPDEADLFSRRVSTDQIRCVVCDSYTRLPFMEQALGDRVPLVCFDDLGQAAASALVINYTPGARPPHALKPSSRFLGGPAYFVTDVARADRASLVSAEKPRLLAHSGASGRFDHRAGVYRSIQRAAIANDVSTDWLCPTAESRSWVSGNIELRRGDRLIDWSRDGGSVFGRYDYVAGPSSTSLYETLMQGAIPISFVLSGTQTDAKPAWARLGHLLHLDMADLQEPDAIERTIALAVAQRSALLEVLQEGAAVLDGQGAARIAGEIVVLTTGAPGKDSRLEILEDPPVDLIRSCGPGDAPAWWQARTAPLVRALSTHPDHRISWPEHVNWWLSEPAGRFAILHPDGSYAAFFWHKERWIGDTPYLYGGWFPASDRPIFAEVIRLLEWQLEHCAAHFPGHRWVATIDRGNRAVLALNRRMGFTEAGPEARAAARVLFPGTNDRFEILERCA
ncbi:hypothetical protein GCM10011316_17190 [Roseibium aquae]|uniref:UDP-2,4-diacetamido-2,4, 6-trideoxy-beta-L-altropyranose hydrolase n=1 Tax=Roseibium aquae TaxID=1323746 RepID=A0A916THV4_9HYPH|nr:hypothetical protein [Roseibium aquae]GGB45692.1 hypothetical protein GCM10011316_17190 [Roseibium aquae]